MIFFITLLNLADKLSAAPAIDPLTTKPPIGELGSRASGISYVGSTGRYPKDNKGTDIIWHHKPVALDPSKYVTDGLMCWQLLFDPDEQIPQREHTQVQAYVTLHEGHLANGEPTNLPVTEWGRVWHDVNLLSIRPTYDRPIADRPATADPGDLSWFEYPDPSLGTSGQSQEQQALGGVTFVGGAEFASTRQKAHVAGFAHDISLWQGYKVCLILKPFEKNGLFIHTNILGWGGVEASPGTALS